MPEAATRRCSTLRRVPTPTGAHLVADVQGDGPVPLCSPHPLRRRGRGALALSVMVVVSASVSWSRGQDAAPARGVAASTRPIPEGLNFANGLFRERQYALAADEYERFLRGASDPADAVEARYGLANARLF